MVSIVPYDNNLLSNLNLPVELVSNIVKLGDISSHVVIVNHKTRIVIYDINTLEIIKSININNINKIINMSVSKCGNYVVGSNETNVCIWNLKSSELVQVIEVDFDPIYDEQRDGKFRIVGSYYGNNGEPVHTFNSNNELLIACNYQIKSYHLQNIDENPRFVESATFKIPYETKIVCISANPSNNMFACGDLGGNVYIFNSNEGHQQPIHTFTTRQALMRSDHYPEITSIAFNRNILVVSSVGTNNILVDLNTMNIIKIEKPQIEYSGSTFNVKNYMLMPCNTKFIGTYNNITFMWNAITGKVIKKLNMRLENDCAMTPDGTKFATNGWHYDFRLFNYND
jgi:WD40 repeat protein